MGENRSRQLPLDETINRVVREMTNVDARPGFDERVMRRLTRPERQPFTSPRLAAAAAVFVVLIVAAILLRDQRTAPVLPERPPDVATRTSSPQPQVEPAPGAGPNNRSAVPRAATRRYAERPQLVRPAAAASIKAESTEELPIPVVAALEPPPELAVHDIEQRPVSLSQIAVSRIEIDQLNVQPLRPDDERREE